MSSELTSIPSDSRSRLNCNLCGSAAIMSQILCPISLALSLIYFLISSFCSYVTSPKAFSAFSLIWSLLAIIACFVSSILSNASWTLSYVSIFICSAFSFASYIFYLIYSFKVRTLWIQSVVLVGPCSAIDSPISVPWLNCSVA